MKVKSLNGPQLAFFCPVSAEQIKETDLFINSFLALLLVGIPFLPSYDLPFPHWRELGANGQAELCPINYRECLRQKAGNEQVVYQVLGKEELLHFEQVVGVLASLIFSSGVQSRANHLAIDEKQ